MTSLNREDRTESIVDHKMDDSLDEESQEVAGDTLDDLGDKEVPEISGHELDEPEDEENLEIAGHELDEPGDEKSVEVIGDDQDAARVPESNSFANDKPNRSKDKQGKTVTEKKIKFKGIKNKCRVKRMWFLIVVAGVCLLAGGSYYFYQQVNEKKIISRNNIFPIPPDKSVIFEPFILPIQKKQGYTYISLNLLLELSNIKIKKEIVEKKDQVRGIIYDILEQEIHRVEDIDELKKLKTLLIKRANEILSSGEIREAIITDFLLV